MTRDPVCGMQVDEKKAPTSIFQGTEYAFCGPQCKAIFDAQPEAFVGTKEPMKTAR
jgi:YHS domain-containing protein